MNAPSENTCDQLESPSMQEMSVPIAAERFEVVITKQFFRCFSLSN